MKKSKDEIISTMMKFFEPKAKVIKSLKNAKSVDYDL